MIFASDVLTTSVFAAIYIFVPGADSQYRKNPQKLFVIVVQPGDPINDWGKVFNHKTERDSFQAGNAIKDL